MKYMLVSQLTLLDHATQLLQLQSVPYPIDSETVAKLLGVSASTINKAKNSGKLPYTRKVRGVLATVQFVEHQKGKDWWQIHFRALEETKLG